MRQLKEKGYIDGANLNNRKRPVLKLSQDANIHRIPSKSPKNSAGNLLANKHIDSETRIGSGHERSINSFNYHKNYPTKYRKDENDQAMNCENDKMCNLFNSNDNKVTIIK